MMHDTAVLIGCGEAVVVEAANQVLDNRDNAFMRISLYCDGVVCASNHIFCFISLNLLFFLNQ